MDSFMKKELIEENYKVINLSEHVLLVEDFASQEEIKEILNIINSTDEEIWFEAYKQSVIDFCLLKFGTDDVESVVKQGKYEITQDWDDKILNVKEDPMVQILSKRINDLVQKADNTLETSLAIIQRMKEGVRLVSHTDQYTDPAIRYATVLYINDDYVDGQVFFKKLGISLVPKSGSLLIFPGDDAHEHGVEYVGKGPIRYVMPGFIKVKGFYDTHRY